MAKAPVSSTSSSVVSSALGKVAVGPKLIGLGAMLFVLTRIITWLPLGILGTWVNGFLWPILLISIAAGVGLMVLKSRRS